MITISKSVGKAGTNLSKDIRSIQVMLFEAGIISKKTFIKECLKLTILDPTEVIEEMINSAQINQSHRILKITEGSLKQSERNLQETIAGIFKFQKEVLKYRNPDGRIDPGGGTIRNLNVHYKNALKSKDIQVKSHSVQINGDRITLKMQIANNVATRFFSAAKTRRYILKNYNRNGAVKLMRKVYELNGEQYFPSTQLTGTSSDDEFIIPTQGIAHILSAQLSDLISKTKPTAANIHELISKPDGLPGNGFITKILGEKSLVAFLSESDNNSMTRLEDGRKLIAPATKESHDDFYDFFRGLVRSRNGLWSDEPGIVNLVGFRRVLDKTFKTAYNDTLAVCVKEEDENGAIVPKVELFIGSTEPGNRKTDRQLVPQTMDLVPGLHFYRQPAGRTRNAVKQEKNNGSYTWEPGDTTMNFHQGANNFRYFGNTSSARKSWLSSFGFNSKIKLGQPTDDYDEKDLLNLNAVLSEIYLILSRYGDNGKTAPYERLKKDSKVQVAEYQGFSNGLMKVSLGNKTKEIDVQKAKDWAVKHWIAPGKKAKRDKFAEILGELKVFEKKSVSTFKSLSAPNKVKDLEQALINELKDEHIEKVVKGQIKYSKSLKEIDGLPGPSFLEIAAGIRTSYVQAKEDKKRIDELFEKLESFPLKKTKTMISRIKSSMRINTRRNREKIYLNFKDDPRIKSAVVERTTVGAFSQGCQIIYDTEIFYEFWTKLLHRGQKSGQERWYYTLIDATGWKGVDWT